MTICFYPKRAAGTALFKTFQKYEKLMFMAVIAMVLTVFNAWEKDQPQNPRL